MAKQYFRTIMTKDHREEDVARDHGQKLNNYLKYDWPVPDAQMTDMKRVALPYEREVESQSTTSTVKNNEFILVTTLCCEDDHGEDEDNK